MLTRAADGVELWWEIEGDGPVVLLIPGRGDSSDAYPRRATDEIVRHGHAVLRFDPRDTGLSAAGGDAYTLTTMAYDAIAVLDAAEVDTAHVVGWSMAGMIMVDLLERFPDRIASAAFLAAMSPDPAGGMGPDFFAALGSDPVTAAIAAMGSPTEADRSWVQEEFERACRRAPLRPEAGERHQLAAMRFGWPQLAALSRVSVPALVIHGGADRVLPAAHAEALARCIAGARLHVVEGMGHAFTQAEWGTIVSLVVDHLASAGR